MPLGRASSFEVYAQGEIALAERDQVRVTRNGFDANGRRLNNEESLKVVRLTQDGLISLRNAQSKTLYEVSQEFGHLEHAYCTTSHAAQGKTVDEVLIAQPAATFPATDAKQCYVSVSRGKDRCRIYTDDKAQLLVHAAEIGDRQSALELLSKTDMTKEAARRRKRAELLRELPMPSADQSLQQSQKGIEHEQPRV